MFNYFSKINCPTCHYQPKRLNRWECEECGHRWNIFDTYGKCPHCGHTHAETECPKCHDLNSHTDWYIDWRDVELEFAD
ncbi:MAG: hypothetical protein MUE85_15435 [Microscillaceae bacterium]|jgi:hypothetical protein|nr:hypothetical protein [Microscillaceae bacterium]